MNEQLKKQGWQQMESLLDQELPRNKKNNKYLFWILIPAVLGGFGLGYFTRSVTTNPPIPVIQPGLSNSPMTALAVESAQTSRESNLAVPMRSLSKNTFHETKQAQKHKAEDIFTTPVSTITFFRPTLANQPTEQTEFVKQIPSSDIYTSSTERLPVNFILPLETLQGTFSNIQNPSTTSHPAVQVNTKWKPFQQIALEVGSNWQKPTATSAAVFYRLGWKQQKSYIYSALGYRYIDYSISEKLDTLSYGLINTPVMSNENFQNQKILEVGSIHQIIPTVGFGYYFNPFWFADISFRLPLNLHFGTSSQDAALADQENTGTEYLLSHKSSANGQNHWDAQTCFTIGKRFRNNLSVTASASLGYIPINDQALLNGKNLKYNQWTAGLSYTF